MVDAIIIILVIALLALAVKGSIKHFKGEGSCCGGSHESLTPDEKVLTMPILGKKTLKVQGMHCEHCVAHVTKAINEIEGASAKVDLKKEMAVVSYDREIDDHVLLEAIEKAGYQAKLLEN